MATVLPQESPPSACFASAEGPSGPATEGGHRRSGVRCGGGHRGAKGHSSPAREGRGRLSLASRVGRSARRPTGARERGPHTGHGTQHKARPNSAKGTGCPLTPSTKPTPTTPSKYNEPHFNPTVHHNPPRTPRETSHRTRESHAPPLQPLQPKERSRAANLSQTPILISHHPPSLRSNPNRSLHPNLATSLPNIPPKPHDPPQATHVASSLLVHTPSLLVSLRPAPSLLVHQPSSLLVHASRACSSTPQPARPPPAFSSTPSLLVHPPACSLRPQPARPPPACSSAPSLLVRPHHVPPACSSAPSLLVPPQLLVRPSLLVRPHPSLLVPLVHPPACSSTRPAPSLLVRPQPLVPPPACLVPPPACSSPQPARPPPACQPIAARPAPFGL
nr:extensin-like [Penaeus vannamei]